MLSREERLALTANGGLFTRELESRGIEIEIIDRFDELMIARHGGREELLVGYFSSIVPHVNAQVADNKFLLKEMLRRAELPYVPGSRFDVRAGGYAFAYARGLGLPVVFKPVFGSAGAHVVLDIEDAIQLDDAIEAFAMARGPKAAFLVEKQIPWPEIRVFITRLGDYAAVHRDPAHVYGDGRHTILELANLESYRRAHLVEDNCLCAIRIDDRVTRHLARDGRSLDSRPADGEKVYLRKNSNASDGAAVDDVTMSVHPSLVRACKQALDALRLPYVGFDVLCRDFTRPCGPGDYYFLEANSRPSVGMHLNPGSGPHRNAFAKIADLIFPETARAAPPEPGQLRPIEVGTIHGADPSPVS